MPRIELSKGASLAYDDQGPTEATPIVLIHGISMSRRYFQGQLDPMAADHRVIALDLRGTVTPTTWSPVTRSLSARAISACCWRSWI